jgi:hypothetical protein
MTAAWLAPDPQVRQKIRAGLRPRSFLHGALVENLLNNQSARRNPVSLSEAMKSL